MGLDEMISMKTPHFAASKDTFWDLGISDATVLIFTQSVGSAVHVIDCYEASN